MDKKRYYLAIDIGASSGRHIIGYKEDGELKTKEVYRFPNSVKKESGSLIWDIDALLMHVKEGISQACEEYADIESLSIDTWGVDYVLLDESDNVIYPVYAYRDSRGEKAAEALHRIISFDRLYERTGIQYQGFNTIYQLYDDLKKGRLARADKLMMIPEYLMYRLTGVYAREYTNATTTGLVNATTGEYDTELIRLLGYPEKLFPKLVKPGTILGRLTESVSKETKADIKVVLCATHDTGSAVEGIEMETLAPYISSGTWSLLGVKTDRPLTDPGSMRANYSNEGGVGYNRYQKNIMGMWIINELKRELCPDSDFDSIISEAAGSGCNARLDANDPSLFAPASMKEAFDTLLPGELCGVGDYFKCAYASLALSYKKAVEELEINTGKSYDRIYIVGGGAKNTYLNDLTEKAMNKKVIALPIEATAIGNLKIQMQVTDRV